MELGLAAKFAILLELQFGTLFALCFHVNLVPVRNVILVFTDGTD